MIVYIACYQCCNLLLNIQIFFFKIIKGHDLEKERTEDEFMAMYEQYEAFDDLEEEYLDIEEEVTALVASYVDDHLEFAKI